MKTKLTPNGALELLVQGNETLLGEGGQARQVRLKEIREAGDAAHEPVAVVLTCADARISPETIFDRGPGDLFTLRVAGNMLTPQQEGSIEFAVSEFRAPLVIVMGHTKCGAISAAIDAEFNGFKAPSKNIESLIEAIRPAARRAISDGASLADPKSRAKAAMSTCWEHVNASVKRLRENPILAGKANAGALLIVGAVYELESGHVRFNWEELREQQSTVKGGLVLGKVAR